MAKTYRIDFGTLGDEYVRFGLIENAPRMRQALGRMAYNVGQSARKINSQVKKEHGARVPDIYSGKYFDYYRQFKKSLTLNVSPASDARPR